MKKIIFIGVLSFLLAALWLTPLSFVEPHIKKLNNNIMFENVSGTLWKGEIQDLSIQNNYLGKVNWSVSPLQSIKSLSLKSDFQISGEELNASGMAGIRYNKTLTLENTEFDLSAEYINRLQKNAKLSGNFKGNITLAEIQEKQVPQIDGVVDWQNGALNSPIKLEPGDYRAILKPSSGDLDVKLSSKEAPIELNGDIKLQKDWMFNTNLISKSANPGLTAMMKFAGKAQNDGSVLIKHKGDLKPFIGL